MLEPYSPTVLWMVIVGFIIAFVLAFGIGANDVANSFGTSVGAKVLTVRQACYLATIFEIAGAILIGYKVSDTMRKGILDVNMYEDHEKEFMMGLVSSLFASAFWMLVATFLKLPISGTHSIVGATVGFSIVARGTQGIKWSMLSTIVASWFISPLMSGLISVIIYFVIRRCVLHTAEPLFNGYKALPYFYGFTIFINVFSIVHDGPKLLYMDHIPLWGALICGLGTGLLAMLLAWILLVPHNEAAKDNAKASFTMGSREISPTNSPNHDSNFNTNNKGKVNYTNNDWHNPLETVSESTELDNSYKTVREVPLMNDTLNKGDFNCEKSLALDKNDLARLASTEEVNSMLSSSLSPQAAPIKRTLEANNTYSLNNVDLTVTSLKYIDDSTSFNKSLDSNPVNDIANSYDSNHSGYLRNFADGINDTITNSYPVVSEPGVSLKQLFQPLKNANEEKKDSGIEKVNEGCVSIFMPHEDQTRQYLGKKANFLCGLQDSGRRMSTGSKAITKSIVKLRSVDSGVNLKDMNPVMTPNSSAVPLISGGKKALRQSSVDSSKRIGVHGAEEERRSGVAQLFSFLQVLTATFGSFAHGGNDVSNAIGPVVGLWVLYAEGSAQQKAETPLLILLYGGVGISIGLWLWGRRVIQTVGEDLTEITPSTGFTIEIGAALTVLIASKVGLPISTTHCKVGSVVCVGYTKGKSEGVDWKIFRNIIFAWVVTVPLAAIISGLFMYMLQSLAL